MEWANSSVSTSGLVPDIRCQNRLLETETSNDRLVSITGANQRERYITNWEYHMVRLEIIIDMVPDAFALGMNEIELFHW